MKTLDEVIKNLGDGTEHLSAILISKETWSDALSYLNEYKELSKMWNDRLDKENSNPPLTWDELKDMIGKPVWVEALLYKQWAIIACVGSDHIRFEGANLYAPESRVYMGDANGWQAYRKERE